MKKARIVSVRVIGDPADIKLFVNILQEIFGDLLVSGPKKNKDETGYRAYFPVALTMKEEA